MEQHRPIIDKLGDLGGRTYRQTYRCTIDNRAMNSCFRCLQKLLYLESPQEPPNTKSYICSLIFPVRRRMSGIHRMFAFPRAFVPLGRIYQVTLVQSLQRDDPLTALMKTVTDIQCKKSMILAPWKFEWLEVSKSLWYHQGIYLKQKIQYKMCHRPRNFSWRDVIQPCNLKTEWKVEDRSQTSKRYNQQNNTKTDLLSCNVPNKEIQGIQSVPDQDSHRHVGHRYHGRTEDSLYTETDMHRCSQMGHTFLKYIQWLRMLTQYSNLRSLWWNLVSLGNWRLMD